MSRTATALMIAGAIGASVGIGYAIHSRREDRDNTYVHCSHLRTKRGQTDDRITAPLPEPKHPRLRAFINRSHHRRGVVQEGPNELVLQARRFDDQVDLDELTGARLVASEYHSGTFTELVCIVDAEQNRADRKGQNLFVSLTHEFRFGKQGGKRPASTRLDPRMIHLLAARAVISGEARGISRGAERFFDPEAMDAMHARYRRWRDNGRKGKKPAVVSCDALTLLEAWSFDYGKLGKSRCPPDRSRPGRKPLAWVGPIPGVDPLQLMLMKPMPLGPEHTRQYEAARNLLLRRKVA